MTASLFAHLFWFGTHGWRGRGRQALRGSFPDGRRISSLARPASSCNTQTVGSLREENSARQMQLLLGRRRCSARHLLRFLFRFQKTASQLSGAPSDWGLETWSCSSSPGRKAKALSCCSEWVFRDKARSRAGWAPRRAGCSCPSRVPAFAGLTWARPVLA